MADASWCLLEHSISTWLCRREWCLRFKCIFPARLLWKQDYCKGKTTVKTWVVSVMYEQLVSSGFVQQFPVVSSLSKQVRLPTTGMCIQVSHKNGMHVSWGSWSLFLRREMWSLYLTSWVLRHHYPSFLIWHFPSSCPLFPSSTGITKIRMTSFTLRTQWKKRRQA